MPPCRNATILNYLNVKERGCHYLLQDFSTPQCPPSLTPQYLTILMSKRGDAIIFCRILAPPNAPPPSQTPQYNILMTGRGGRQMSRKKLNKNSVTNLVRWWGGGGALKSKYSQTKNMTTFSFYSFKFLKISLYIIFLNLWLDFGAPLRAAPGGSCPSPAPPRYATGYMHMCGKTQPHVYVWYNLVTYICVVQLSYMHSVANLAALGCVRFCFLTCKIWPF